MTLISMNSPYEPPRSKIKDLNYQPLPHSLKLLYGLMSLAVLCSVSFTTISFIVTLQKEPWILSLSWDGVLFFIMALIASYSLNFVFYYFLVFRPLHKRKRSTYKWWLSALLILLLGLWGAVLLFTLGVSSEEGLLIQKILSGLEPVFLGLGVIHASRPATLEHLPH